MIVYHRYDVPKVETVSDEITLSDGSTRPNTAEARAAYQAEKQRAFEAVQQRQAALNRLHTGRGCPFQYDVNSGRPRECKKSCAFYQGDGCVFAGQAATIDTKGRDCPFMGGKPCNDGCMMYNGGCALLTNCKGE